MAKICQITGKSAMAGNKVSHANNKTKRRFNLNLFEKKYFLPSQEKWVKLKVSTQGMRTIDKLGVEEAIGKAMEKGYIKELKLF